MRVNVVLALVALVMHLAILCVAEKLVIRDGAMEAAGRLDIVGQGNNTVILAAASDGNGHGVIPPSSPQVPPDPPDMPVPSLSA